MKLAKFILLKGLSLEDSLFIQREKLRFIAYRIFRIFTKLPPFTMGQTLEKDVVAINSYGNFFCRHKTFDLHIISDSYESKVVELFKDLASKSETIVDAGANIGKFSILANKINPSAKIFAFEPEEDNFEILSKNKELNKAQNITLVKKGLDEKKGFVKLNAPKEKQNKGGYSITNLSKSFERIATDKLDNLFVNIDLIKIDTEGAEMRILQGAKKLLEDGKIKWIILELNVPLLKKFLGNYGYSSKKIQGNNYFFWREK